jgi:predicted dehydrogenase
MRNLLALGHSDVIACRSSRESRPAMPSVPTFYTLDEALAEGPSAVVISNPTSLHIPVAIRAAEAGCHLFLEKPLSHTLDGVPELSKLVAERGTVATVAYNLRFHPMIQRLRQVVINGEIGKILSVRAWVGQYLPDWHPGEDYRASYMAKPELGGGVILTLSHELDYLRWLFGRVAEVTAVARSTSNLEMSTDSVAEITMLFENDVLAQVHLDCLQRTPSRGCEFNGTEGTVRADVMDSVLEILRPAAAPERIVVPKADSNQTYMDELRDFLGCVRGGGAPQVRFEEGIATLKVALAAHRAAATGEKQLCR